MFLTETPEQCLRLERNLKVHVGFLKQIQKPWKPAFEIVPLSLKGRDVAVYNAVRITLSHFLKEV